MESSEPVVTKRTGNVQIESDLLKPSSSQAIKKIRKKYRFSSDSDSDSDDNEPPKRLKK